LLAQAAFGPDQKSMPAWSIWSRGMRTNEVDLNDPLNWYIADSMDDYDVRLDPEMAKKLVHRHNGYPKLVNALREAIATLEKVGCAEKADSLKLQLQELGEPEQI
jgi:hypothetical protein